MFARECGQVREHGAETEWMAFIDLDEFLYAAGFNHLFDHPFDHFLTTFVGPPRIR